MVRNMRLSINGCKKKYVAAILSSLCENKKKGIVYKILIGGYSYPLVSNHLNDDT